uniref:NADH dehydrogenase subunit 6 n=1 Tax=Callochiton steinenii TaxID=2719128 RepID=A0A6H1PGB0_9MOLL|nr:NADH dehydrogenase subunit 6 [Callochiton steinenii]
MMIIMLFSFLMSLMLVFPLMVQPLSVGGLVLIMSFVISAMVGFQINSWFGFVLFLIYIGGLLIMFIYVASLVPNMIFNNTFIIMGFVLFYLLFMFMFFNIEFLGGFMEMDSLMINNKSTLFNMLGITMFSKENINIIMGLGIILFLVLICVVKICYFSMGPLRSFKY